ncbi:MAG TPA: MFS transporter [Candidatus Brocadiia bacterium]|nr:MFS transporter [Candidatus Brocadiia bacterium]
MEEFGERNWKRTLYASTVAQFFCGTGFSFVFPFMPLYIRSMGVTNAADLRQWAGLVSGASSFTMAIFAPIWGSVADRHGRKLMAMRAMFGASLMLALMGFARSPGQLMALRLAQGALSGVIAANTALVASVTPAARMGYAMGLIHAAAHAGRVFGPTLGGLLADWFNFRVAFWVGAGLLLGAGALVKFFTSAPPAPPGAHKGGLASWTGLFALAGFSVALIAMFQVQFATSIAMPIFPLLVESLRGTGEKAASITGAIFTVNAVAGVVSTGWLGRMSDRVGHRKLLIVCSLAAAVILLLHAAAQNVGQVFALRFLLGLATAGLIPSATALVRRAVPAQNIGKAFGVAQSVRSLGMTAGPLAGGCIAAHIPGEAGLRVPFLVTGVVFLLVPIVVMLLLKPDGRGENPAEPS